MIIKSQKGIIESIGDGVLYVISESNENVWEIPISDANNYFVGQKLKFLIQEVKGGKPIINIVEKQIVKSNKTKKLINYSSLLKQIDKLHSKLVEYLKSPQSEKVDQDFIDDLQEKIEYLEKGKELFQK